MGKSKTQKVAPAWQFVTFLFPMPCPQCGVEVRAVYRHNPQQWEGCRACVNADVIAATLTEARRYMEANPDMPWPEYPGE